MVLVGGVTSYTGRSSGNIGVGIGFIVTSGSGYCYFSDGISVGSDDCLVLLRGVCMFGTLGSGKLSMDISSSTMCGIVRGGGAGVTMSHISLLL